MCWSGLGTLLGIGKEVWDELGVSHGAAQVWGVCTMCTVCVRVNKRGFLLESGEKLVWKGGLGSKCRGCKPVTQRMCSAYRNVTIWSTQGF